MRFRGLFHSQAISMYPVKKRNIPILLVLVGILCFSIAPTARGFIVFEHEGWDDLNTLIKKVHEDHWVIHYSYGDNCPPEEQNNDAALTAAITKALQTWLQPLRNYTPKPIVNDFRYQRIDIADWKNAPDPGIIFRPADLGIVFYCAPGTSYARIRRLGSDETPYIALRATTNVEQTGFMSELVHEMGHIFGLADAYTRKDRDERWLTKGGLDGTKGTQPASRMSGYSTGRDGKQGLGRDDKNGIVYLYKVAYEGLAIRDCFFTDYQLEHEPLGCVPKHPLIFELKHSIEIHALWILEEDEALDVNAQDENGMTALHYAVLHGYNRVVKVLLGHKVISGGRVINLPPNNDINVNAQDEDGMTALHHAVLREQDDFVLELLAHKDIKPFLRNKQGHSSLRLARDNKFDRMMTLLLEHPLTLPVSAKGKLATTWGHLKKQY